MKTYLHSTPERLELRAEGPDAPGPLFVDFLSGKVAHRRRYGGGRRQLIGRAVGLKPNVRLRIVDATGGLGRDAYILATLGCQVTLVERSPIIVALLRDGIQRARVDPEFRALALCLVEAEACHYLYHLSDMEKPDVVYCDPMFPEAKKSALSKKEMRMLKSTLTEHDNSEALLEAALSTAKKRVVVKRPRHAQSIIGPKPSVVLNGKSTRFDIYLVV